MRAAQVKQPAPPSEQGRDNLFEAPCFLVCNSVLIEWLIGKEAQFDGGQMLWVFAIDPDHQVDGRIALH
jgi:hypothetical protein